jgi:hypothetical protein
MGLLLSAVLAGIAEKLQWQEQKHTSSSVGMEGWLQLSAEQPDVGRGVAAARDLRRTSHICSKPPEDTAYSRTGIVTKE